MHMWLSQLALYVDAHAALLLMHMWLLHVLTLSLFLHVLTLDLNWHVLTLTCPTSSGSLV